jgi:hypothetical protein
MLVDRGLLTPEELDEVLAVQKESGRKLGEIIVERGYISGPTLALTLAEQWGVELTADEGFGTGLRNEIQRRHEGERKRRPALHAVDEPALKGHEIFGAEDDGALAELNAQLAEDDARIVHLEARLLKRDDRIAKLEDEAREREARVTELISAELSRLEARFSETQKDLLAAAADWRAKHEAQIVKLLADKLGRLEAGIKEARQVELRTDDRAELGRGIADLVTEEHAETRKQLVAAVEKAALTKTQANGKDTEARERIPELVSRQLADARRELLAATSKQRKAEEERLAKLLEDKLAALEFPASNERVPEEVLTQKLTDAHTELLAALSDERKADEDRLTRLVDDKLGALELPVPDQQGLKEVLAQQLAEARRELLAASSKQRAAEEERLAKLVQDKLDAFEVPVPELPAVDLGAHEERLSSVVARVEKALTSREEQLSEANEKLIAKVDELQAALESLARPRKRDELAWLGTDLRTTVKRLDRIEELVRTSTRELFERLEHPPVRPGAEPAPVEVAHAEVEEAEPEPTFTEHLVFAPSKAGYSLLTVELPPPIVGAEVSLGNGERYQVTKVAESPFPRDERPCAYVQRVS